MSLHRHMRSARVLMHHVVWWCLFAACVSVITGVAVVGLLHGGSPSALGARSGPALLGSNCAGSNAAVVIFRGARYRPETLERSWLRARATLGDAIIESSALCAPGSRMHVYALRGVPPTRALSRGGSSRKLMIRTGACPTPALESALLRCLRGQADTTATTRSIRRREEQVRAARPRAQRADATA
jgi:hypothetical protein